MTPTQQEKADQLRALHAGLSLLVLPNAWDAASARLFEQAGFPAIATTSSGVAATLGYPDGQHISRALLVEQTARIVGAVSCPVSADIEAGYGASVEEVLQTVRLILETGVVGINIEDSARGPQHALVDVGYQVELLHAIRQLGASLGVPLVINARVDAFLLTRDHAGAFDEAVARARAYHQAGADCVFPIMLSDARLIERFVQAVSAPVNILAGPHTPTLPDLARLGVRRVTFGGGLLRAALGHLRQVVQELREQGTYTHMADLLPAAEFRALFG